MGREPDLVVQSHTAVLKIGHSGGDYGGSVASRMWVVEPETQAMGLQPNPSFTTHQLGHLGQVTNGQFPHVQNEN